MLEHPLGENTGQLIASTIGWKFRFKDAEIDRLTAFFEASLHWADDISEGDRTHLDSYTFRYRLANRFYGVTRYSGYSDDPTITDLGLRPRKWIESHLNNALKTTIGEVNASVARALDVLKVTSFPVNLVEEQSIGKAGRTVPPSTSLNNVTVAKRDMGADKANARLSELKSLIWVAIAVASTVLVVVRLRQKRGVK